MDFDVQKGRVIALSVKIFICLFVSGHENQHLERSRRVYELDLQRMSPKCGFYVPHDRERLSKSSEKLTFDFNLMLSTVF